MRLPELKKLLHLVAVQFHPLAPKLDQWRFCVDKLLPFLFGNSLAANGQLILVGDDHVEIKIALTGSGCPLGRTQRCFEADLRAAASFGGPPRRNHHGVARVCKHPGALFQERKRLLQRETASSRVVGAPSRPRALDRSGRHTPGPAADFSRSPGRNGEQSQRALRA